MEDRDVAVKVSPITAFEIGQKAARGKLQLNLPPEKWFPLALELHGLREAAFHSRIALSAAALPDLHHDPFPTLPRTPVRGTKIFSGRFSYRSLG